MKKKEYFIVQYDGAGALRSSPVLSLHKGFKSKSKILMISGEVTLFPDYEAARLAIQRTLRYMRRHSMRWTILYGKHLIRKASVL